MLLLLLLLDDDDDGGGLAPNQPAARTEAVSAHVPVEGGRQHHPAQAGACIDQLLYASSTH